MTQKQIIEQVFAQPCGESYDSIKYPLWRQVREQINMSAYIQLESITASIEENVYLPVRNQLRRLL